MKLITNKQSLNCSFSEPKEEQREKSKDYSQHQQHTYRWPFSKIKVHGIYQRISVFRLINYGSDEGILKRRSILNELCPFRDIS